MEKDKKIKITLHLIVFVVVTVTLIFVGYLFYLIKGIMSGGGMMGEAIYQSELQASKYDETNSPEACEKLRKELEEKYLEHPNVKNRTCLK